ncbi:MAG: spondin domain-containing protein [Rhodothermales bacterium]
MLVQAHAQSTTAEYTVAFESTWSAATHPAGFPGNPHFSGLIGATHDSTVTFWSPNELASAGIESMAETGSKSSLLSAVNNAIDFGNAEHLLSGGGIGVSPGRVTLSFNISDQFPLVSLVSMLAPSPDWFVGVHDLNLYENNTWIDELVVDLFVYDAGTDSGTDYTSPNADTQPAENIFQINTVPFLNNDAVAPVATFTFNLVAAVGQEKSPEFPDEMTISPAYPNPFSTQTQFIIRVAQTEQVDIKVFDLLGREVDTLFDGTLIAGNNHQFSFNAKHLPAGQYIVRIKGATTASARILQLIK